ncbi:TPA: hypothetical protein ACKP1B_005751 [Serratia fonticola]
MAHNNLTIHITTACDANDICKVEPRAFGFSKEAICDSPMMHILTPLPVMPQRWRESLPDVCCQSLNVPICERN